MKIKLFIFIISFIILILNLFDILSNYFSVIILFILITIIAVLSIFEDILLRKNLKLFTSAFEKMHKGDFSIKLFFNPDHILFDCATELNTLSRQVEGIVKDQVNKSWELYKWNMNLGGIIEKKESEIKEFEQDINELEEKNRELDKKSKTDGLTALYNHKYIYERLEQEILKAKKFNKTLSIIMFDIDHFKSVNDTYGHQEGDNVILSVANALRTQCRKFDILGRYGGEEFLVILPNTSIEGAFMTAERIRTKVEYLSFDSGLSVTISGGAVELKNEDALALVKKADEKLYTAKESGRNKIIN